MADFPTAAVARLGEYNGARYDAQTNPYGMAIGGHRQNFPPSLNDTAVVVNYVGAAATEIAAFAQQTADDRRQTGEDRVQTGLDRQAAATFNPALYARKDGAQFTGDVEVRGVGNGLRHHIPGVIEGVWRIQDDGRLVWFIGDSTPALTIFPDGDLFFHGANLRLSAQMAARLRFDAAQALTSTQQFRALQNLGFNDYWSGLRGASSAANLRSAIDVDRARQVIEISGGNEQAGLASVLTSRLSFDFVARAATALFNGSCSVKASTNQFHFAYLHLRVADLTAGGYAGGTTEQVVSMEINAGGRFYGLSRSLALSNLVIGRTYRVELCPRVDADNAGTPQGMIISGVN